MNEPSGKASLMALNRRIHKSDLPFQLGYAFNWTNTTTLAAIKLSALFLYRRAFVPSSKPRDWFNITTLTLAVIIVCWYITFMFLASFQCPGHFNAVEEGEATEYCTLNYSWALGLAVSDFLLDLIVLLVPIPRVSTPRPPLSTTQYSQPAGLATARHAPEKTLHNRRFRPRFRVSTDPTSLLPCRKTHPATSNPTLRTAVSQPPSRASTSTS